MSPCHNFNLSLELCNQKQFVIQSEEKDPSILLLYFALRKSSMRIAPSTPIKALPITSGTQYNRISNFFVEIHQDDCVQLVNRESVPEAPQQCQGTKPVFSIDNRLSRPNFARTFSRPDGMMPRPISQR
jgi:hypothetical protein